MVNNTDPYGIPMQQSTVIPYSQTTDQTNQGTSQQYSQYMQPQMSLQYFQQPSNNSNYTQYFQDFQNSQRHISSQISQLQSQYADQAAKFQQLGPYFNAQLQSGFTDFSNNFGTQYSALQTQFQQQQQQQQQQQYNAYVQSLQNNQQQLKAQNTQFHSQLQNSIEQGFDGYKNYIANLLKTHADVFVNGFNTYYNDTKYFLNSKLEDLQRQMSLSTDSDKVSQDRLSNQITSIQQNLSTIDRLSGYLTSDINKVQTLQTEFATQASQHNTESTNRICNIVNYLFQSLENKQSHLQDTLNADRRLSNQNSLSADLYTFTNDLKSEMKNITKYINSTVDTIVRQRDDRFEQAFNVKISELSDHLRQSVNQLSSVDILQQVPVRSKQQSPAVSQRSANVGRPPSNVSQTNIPTVQQSVPPVQTQVPYQSVAPQQQVSYPPGFNQVPQYTQPSPQQYIQPMQYQPQYQQYQYGFAQSQSPALQAQAQVPLPPPPPNPPPGFSSGQYIGNPPSNNGINAQSGQQVQNYQNTPSVLTNSHAGLPSYNGSTPLQPWLRKLEREIQGFQYSDHQAVLLAQSKFDGDVAMWSDQNDSQFMSYRHPTHSLLNQYSYILLKPLLEQAFSRSQEDFLESLDKVKQQPQESYSRFMRRLQNESQHGHVSLQYIKSLFIRNMHNRNVAVSLKSDVRDPSINLHQLVREAVKVSKDLGVLTPVNRINQQRSRSQSPLSFRSRKSRSVRSFSPYSSRSYSPSSFSSQRRSFSPSPRARPYRKYPNSPRYNNSSPRFRDRNQPHRPFSDNRREQPRSPTPQKVSSVYRYGNPYQSYDFDAVSQQPSPIQPVYEYRAPIQQSQVPVQSLQQPTQQQVSQPQPQSLSPIFTVPQQQSNTVTSGFKKGNVVVKDVSNFSVKDTLSNLKLQLDLPQALSQGSSMYNSFMDFVNTIPKTSSSSPHVGSVSTRHQITTGPIEYLWHIPVLLKNLPFQAMLDTGSQPSLINIQVCERLGIKSIQSVTSSYVAANKTAFVPLGLVKLPVQLSDQLDVLLDFYVVKDSSFQVLLGLDFIEHTKMVIYCNKVQVKDPITRRYLDLALIKQPLYSFSVVQSINSCSFSFLFFLLSILLIFPFLFYKFLTYMYNFLIQPTHLALAQFFVPPFHNFDPAHQVFCSPLHVLIFLIFICITILFFRQVFFCSSRFQQFCTVISTTRTKRKKTKNIPRVIRRLKMHRKHSYNSNVHILFPKFPFHKKYHLILCDAPWHYDAQSPLTPSYRTLSFSQLKSLPIQSITHDTSIFLYWTTGPMLSNATALARHYGFKHLTVLHSWRKVMPNGSPYVSKTSYGTLTQPNTEYLIIGFKGQYKQLMHKNIPPISQELSTLALPHSQKPSQVYSTIEQIFKVYSINCLELFARTQSHPYFDLYGDAVQGYFQPCQKVLQDNCNFSMTLGEVLPSVSPSPLKQERIFQFPNSFSNDLKARLTLLLRYTSFINDDLSQCIHFLANFQDIFAWDSHEVGRMSNVFHNIQLIPTAVPKAFPPYRLSPQDREFVEKEIFELLRLGYIVRGVSPWAAPVLVVPKEGGKRMVIDFRHLNSQTVKQHWPLPTFDDFLSYLLTAKVLSKLDLRSSFLNQLYASDADEQLTSFVCHLGQFICKRLWFGLCNAPSSFQRGIMDALGDLVFKCCIVYIDDILIFSNSFKDHILHLTEVFKRLASANVRLHPSKCQLFTTKCDFLGHTIDNGTIRPKLKRHNLLQTMTPPTTKTQVKCFLGLISYYRRFVPNFSSIAEPLNILLQKDTPFQWKEAQQTAFDMLRQKLLSLPTLYLPSQTRQFCVTTDFSCKGLGAILGQLDDQHKELPIAFISRTLNKFEKRYGSYEGEVLAVMFALSKFRHYLLGQHFLLYTDNKALQQVLHHKSPSPKIHRWLLQLSEYTFTVIHRKGTENSNADALSRLAPLTSQVSTILRKKHVRFIRRPRIFKYSSNSFPRIHKRYRNFLKSSFIIKPQLQSILRKPKTIFSVQTQPYQPIDLTDLQCEKCFKTDPVDMLICEKCGHGFHKQCFPPCPPYVPSEFYYCSSCLAFINQSKPSDPIFNFALLNYVKNKSFSSDMSSFEKDSISRTAQNFRFSEGQFQISFGNSWRIFPSQLARTQLLFEMHNNAGHPGIRKTVGLIQTKFHWPSIRTSVTQHIQSCTLCLAKRADFRESQQLMPLPKGDQPFSYWSIDLLTNLPTSIEGYKHILICICSFSKWPELLSLKSKSSLEIAHAIHRDIICRYGKPLAFRSDNGTEFKDSLSQMFHFMGITHTRTNVNRPRANGQAERFVGTLTSLLRNAVHQNSYDLSDWPLCLPTICYTLRMTPSVLNQSPFQIVHGMLPRPIAALDEAATSLPSPRFTQSDIDRYCQTLEKIQQKTFSKTQQHLSQNSALQKVSYDTKPKRNSYNFSKNDLVFKSVGPRMTKLQMPSEGPFVIVDLINESTAEIYDPSTKQYTRSSLYNLIPVPSLKTQTEFAQVLDNPQFEYRKRNYVSKPKPKRKPGRPQKQQN